MKRENQLYNFEILYNNSCKGNNVWEEKIYCNISVVNVGHDSFSRQKEVGVPAG